MPVQHSDADVAIVGAGIIGLLTALELGKAGKSVIVLERDVPGREASWAAAGILTPLGPWRYPESIQQLTFESQLLYPGLCEELQAASGIDPEYSRSGLLVFLDAAEVEAAEQWATGNAVAHEFVQPQDAQQKYPQLTVPGSQVLYLPEAAQIRNPRFLRALLKALEERGVRILPHNPAGGLRIQDDAVTGVQTADDVIHADCVVLAAGAWTQELIPRGVWRPSIRPVKGQMLLYRAGPGLLDKLVLQGSHYLVPRNDGRILAGSSMEEEGFNKSPTVEIKQQLRAFAESVLPALGECEIEAHWTGLRPATIDGLPVVGPHPDIHGLWLNTGHFRNGIALAPASARQLAGQLLSSVSS